MVLKGKAWVFGDNVDADWEICDLDFLQEQAQKGIIPKEEELGKLCLVRLDPQFPGKVKKGDLLVAGANAGCSTACLDGLPNDPHLYASAALALKATGIGAVLCESAAVNFQRNALNAGLPVIESPGITACVQEGEVLEVNLAQGTVRNLSTEAQLRFPPFPEFILQMLAAGGVYNYIAKNGFLK